MGINPTIISIDPEFIKEVVVKQFENFTDVVTDEMPIPPEQTTLDLARYVLGWSKNHAVRYKFDMLCTFRSWTRFTKTIFWKKYQAKSYGLSILLHRGCFIK